HEKPPPSQVQSTHGSVTRWPLSRVNDQTQPVRAVNSDHHRTIRPSTLRGPNRSPSQPLGTSNSAYDRPNTEKTQPNCCGVRPSSRCMSSPTCLMHTRSM